MEFHLILITSVLTSVNLYVKVSVILIINYTVDLFAYRTSILLKKKYMKTIKGFWRLN